MRTRRAPRGLGARLLPREVWQDACVPSVLGMLSVSWASGTTHLGTEPYAKDARSACLSSSASIIALCQFGETKSLLREPFAWVVDKAPSHLRRVATIAAGNQASPPPSRD